jgi:hypothetical protein
MMDSVMDVKTSKASVISLGSSMAVKTSKASVILLGYS